MLCRCVCCCILLFLPALVYGDEQLVISSATYDPTSNAITIKGRSFGLNPIVTFNLVQIQTGDVSPCEASSPETCLIVKLPTPAPGPGSYMLRVIRTNPAGHPKNGQTDFDVFDITLGKVGPQGPPGNSLQCVDANNRIIGNYMDHSTIWSSAGGVIYFMVVNQENLHGSLLWYESADCSGQPYYSIFSPPYSIPFAAVGPPGFSVFVPDEAFSAQDIQTRSYWDQNGLPNQNRCLNWSGNVRAIRAKSLIKLNVTPPFKARQVP